MTNHMNARKKALKFESSEEIEKDLKEMKAEFITGKIEAYPDFDSREPIIYHHRLVCFEYCWYTFSKTRHSGAFYSSTK